MKEPTEEPFEHFSLENKANSESLMKEPRISKRSDTELECPKCEFRTRCDNSMMIHLKLKHSSNTI
ncbi:hypothetical protein PENTCL1PPCAC_12457, partial [Pristionchus entomophagus]